MYDYVARFRALLARLEAHPDIRLHNRVFNAGDDSSNLLTIRAQMLAEEFGIMLSSEDWDLFNIAAVTDIVWYCPLPLTPTTPQGYNGIINTVSISECIRTPRYRLPAFVQEPGAEHASYYDNYAHSDLSPPTMLLYDRADRQYLGLAAFLRPELVPLQLTPSQYVAAALDWYGAPYWQLLYCSLDDFRRLGLIERQHVYRLGKVLPLLFPETEALLATKQAYFGMEQEDRVQGRLTWEL